MIVHPDLVKLNRPGKNLFKKNLEEHVNIFLEGFNQNGTDCGDFDLGGQEIENFILPSNNIDIYTRLEIFVE